MKKIIHKPFIYNGEKYYLAESTNFVTYEVTKVKDGDDEFWEDNRGNKWLVKVDYYCICANGW